MFFHSLSPKYFHVIFSGLLCVGLIGCAEIPKPAFQNGVIIKDSLLTGISKGSVEAGEFGKNGWRVGPDGMILYNLPGMPQGIIEFDVEGLNRISNHATFLTMYEPGGGKYVDPYVLKNPFLVKVTLKNMEQSPDSTFDFLWTLKTFPSSVKPLERYVDGIPEGGGGYINTIAGENIPVYLDQKYTVRLEWKNGKASLYLNDTLAAAHDYRPVLFNPSALTLVLGKSPLEEECGLPDMVISNVRIAFPTR
ncbi:MAG: hypothetical protein C4527_20290 [Candidatus Omnitrophota bacterium]|jgi:hypothetical protein|nr:MAG: hypothetical protein C4527_20290 [Candidatus Omnitrophota bacterium]